MKRLMSKHKSPSVRAKRTNLSKEQIREQMAHNQKIERQKVLARNIFPLITEQESIYDAQTVVQALAGFIKQELHLKVSQIIVKDLPVDFSKETDSPIKASMLAVLELLKMEPADDVVALLERFGTGLSQFSASKYMKEPMSVISVDDFVA